MYSISPIFMFNIRTVLYKCRVVTVIGSDITLSAVNNNEINIRFYSCSRDPWPTAFENDCSL